MKGKQGLVDTFSPKKIKEIDKILLYDLDVINVLKEDDRIQFILNDPYCPDNSLIQGVYVIYKKSVLELLEGKISSIHSYEFINAKKNERTISEEDIEYVLEMATVVVLASESDGVLTKYFYSGTGEKLDSMFNLCLGYSKELEKKEYKVSLQRFMNDIKIVEQMGLLERIIRNK